MKKLLLLLILLSGCGRDDRSADNGTAAVAGGPAVSGKSAAPRATGASETRLTGLFEGGAGEQKNQICLVEKGGDAQFGLIVWGGNLHSCSGAGRAVRSGERLTLTMTGDETCTISAGFKDGKISFPETLPLGCAYYCGARASLGGASFSRAGTGEAEARKARDIAGDPLCD